MNAQQCQTAAELSTKLMDLSLKAARKLHPLSPFIITQPESWYSFYHPAEGRRL